MLREHKALTQLELDLGYYKGYLRCCQVENGLGMAGSYGAYSPEMVEIAKQIGV